MISSIAWDSETGDAHKRFSVHFDRRICGATFYQSLRKFDCKCFRSRALLVTSSDYIFKTFGIQRLAMLTNDLACISTDRDTWCSIFSEPQSAYPSVSTFDCKCFRSRALLATSSDYIFKTLGVQRLAMLTNDSACISTDRICGATIYQSLRVPTPVSQSLTVSVSEPEHFW